MASFERGLRKPITPPPNPLANQYKLYDTAVSQQAGDYDKIMSGYDTLLNTFKNTPNTGTYNPQVYSYQSTPDYMQSVSRLKNLADTGGYSGADIADLRERGVSPIRSVYANAQRDIDRQRAVSGSTSANYAALKARMAREVSQKVADQVTNVNADIAANVARNKIGTAESLGGLTAGEQSERNRIGLAGTQEQNEAARFNIGRGDTKNENILRTIEGMRGLYGTTPALSSLFGSQAMNAAQLQNSINQQNISNGLNVIGSSLRRRTYA